MRLLLDTHVLFWWLAEKTRLSAATLGTIEAVDNEVFVSVASAWEMSIKSRLGKWPEATALISDFERRLEEEAFRELPITIAHVRGAGSIASTHRDPFDRLLVTQSKIEGLTLVTADPKLTALGAEVLW
ncbi:MAG: type II toxin-antitoxin system VapC family toxin [Hyphomicrobiaceae bacterium]